MKTTTPTSKKLDNKVSSTASFPALTEERHRIYEERARANRMGRLATSSGTAPVPRVCNASTKGYYSATDITAPATRPGADDHKRVPSLHMGQRTLPGCGVAA